MADAWGDAVAVERPQWAFRYYTISANSTATIAKVPASVECNQKDEYETRLIKLRYQTVNDSAVLFGIRPKTEVRKRVTFGVAANQEHRNCVFESLRSPSRGETAKRRRTGGGSLRETDKSCGTDVVAQSSDQLEPDPSDISSLAGQLHPSNIRKLKLLNIQKLFPIQRVLIPFLCRSHNASGNSPYSGDVCVSAPTGQGKTICYVIPIIQSLRTRVVPQIRAIVVCPTRELTMQVHRVFEFFCAPAGSERQQNVNRGAELIPPATDNVDDPRFVSPVPPLRAVCVFGQNSFSAELLQLYGQVSDVNNSSQRFHRAPSPSASRETVERGANDSLKLHPWLATGDACGSTVNRRPADLRMSPPDIFVCTPGRLVEHFERSSRGENIPKCTQGYDGTKYLPKATLPGTGHTSLGSNDRFSCCVEAWKRDSDSRGASLARGGGCDGRSLHLSGGASQVKWNFVRWIVIDEADRLLDESYQSWIVVIAEISRMSESSEHSDPPEAPSDLNSSNTPGNCAAHQKLTGATLQGLSEPCKVQKVLFSATMTKNPQKLGTLGLRRPIFFVSNPAGDSAVPTELRQWFIRCTNKEAKVAALIYLLYQLWQQNTETIDQADIQIHCMGGEIENSMQQNDRVSRFSSEALEDTTNEAAGSVLKIHQPTGNRKCVVFCPSKADAHRVTRSLELHFDRLPEKQFAPKHVVSMRKRNNTRNVSMPQGTNRESITLKNGTRKCSHDIFPNAVDVDVSTNDCNIQCTAETTDEYSREQAESGNFDDAAIKRVVPCVPIRLRTGEFSAALSQKERNSLFKKFSSGGLDVLVSSDVLSRGIDISDVDNVINFNVPKFANAYIHRSGRTARAGREGSTYSLVAADESDRFHSIIAKCGEKSNNTPETVAMEHTMPSDENADWRRLVSYTKCELRRAVRLTLYLEQTGRIKPRRPLAAHFAERVFQNN